MGTLENTYCKNTKDNLRRYQSTGWTLVEKLNEGDDFIVARINMGREICHTVSKDSGILNHFKLIEDANPDACYGIMGIKELPGINPVSFNITPKVNDKNMSQIDTISIDTSFVYPEGLTSGYNNISIESGDVSYTKVKITAILEHILSLQKHFTGGSYISVDEMVKELAIFDLYPNPVGKNINGR